MDQVLTQDHVVPIDEASLDRANALDRLLDQWWREGVQTPGYRDFEALKAVIAYLRESPPLLPSTEIDALAQRLGDAATGQGVVLMGGDCAERLSDASIHQAPALATCLDHLGRRIKAAIELEPILVARAAGQLAKPRSNPTEKRGEAELESYRGDMINAARFSAEARDPSLARLLFARALSRYILSIFAMQPLSWPLATAHETLSLPYDIGLTRLENDGRLLCTSAHMLWVGHRTRAPTGAYTAFAATISNPIGVKIGADCDVEEFKAIIQAIGPKLPGRLSLISRMGSEHVADKLPALIEVSQKILSAPLWICDPMHGNAERLPGGTVTRRLSNITREAEAFRKAVETAGLPLGGLHLELSGADITECLDGHDLKEEKDLSRSYTSAMDPRLNCAQATTVLDAFLG